MTLLWFDGAVDSVDHVRLYLRAQNLEQLGRADEALALYEQAVAEGFDATGPYDRLIALYSGRARHGDVVRVAEAALLNVHTHEAKQEWYRQTSTEARRAQTSVPPAVPKRGDGS